MPQGWLRSIEITYYRLQFILADERRAWMGEKPVTVIPVNFYKQVGQGDSLYQLVCSNSQTIKYFLHGSFSAATKWLHAGWLYG